MDRSEVNISPMGIRNELIRPSCEAACGDTKRLEYEVQIGVFVIGEVE